MRYQRGKKWIRYTETTASTCCYWQSEWKKNCQALTTTTTATKSSSSSKRNKEENRKTRRWEETGEKPSKKINMRYKTNINSTYTIKHSFQVIVSFSLCLLFTRLFTWFPLNHIYTHSHLCESVIFFLSSQCISRCVSLFWICFIHTQKTHMHTSTHT